MSLKVIGLISGGKDSLFNLAHCIQNGHHVVALANLYPASNPSGRQTNGIDVAEVKHEDLNSFMYQTVGHSIIPLYAEALEIPLYRRAISGTAAQSGRYYDTSQGANGGNPTAPAAVPLPAAKTTGDETEDMYLLIRDILAQHPEANALAAGAILSTYQRTRVESVATRLNLTPLAYLWQYPFLPPSMNQPDALTRLLDDMAAAGCDARIIKIASGGIGSESLFANITDPSTRARLVKGLSYLIGGSTGQAQEAELRASVLGEGGEYETLALDGPMPLWKKRIDVSSMSAQYVEGVMYAKIKEARLAEKTIDTAVNVPVPVGFDLRFQTVLNQTPSTPWSTKSLAQTEFLSPKLSLATTYTLSPSTLQISNLIISDPSTSTAINQLTTILVEMLPALLKKVSSTQGISPALLAKSNIVHSTLLLRSMDVFTSVNSVYATHLWPTGLPNPPARVTIAANLPLNIEVSLSVTFDLTGGAKSETRNGLHVQSRSYWAPANIGPYSQAISVPLQRYPRDGRDTGDNVVPHPNDVDCAETATPSPIEIVHMAGQIPLVPASMTLPETDHFEQHAVLALQHLWRVGQERRVDLWAGAGVAYLASIADKNDAKRAASIAAQVWRSAHMVDAKGNLRTVDHQQPDSTNNEDDDDDDGDVVDIWDLQHNRGYAHHSTPMTIGEHTHVLPNHDVLLADNNIFSPATYTPRFIAVEVSALPRGASIEWWSFGLAGLMSSVARERYTISSKQGRDEDLFEKTILAIEEKYEKEFTGVLLDSGDQRKRNVYFVTVVIPANAAITARLHDNDNSLDGLFSEPLAEMMEVELENVEIVASHSFINANCADAEIICNHDLVKQSSVVLCHRIWTAAPGYNRHGQNVQETAAAILLRIEATVNKELSITGAASEPLDG